MWIGRETMLHQHERDLRRALDRRAALRLARQARRNRRAIAIGRQRLPGPVRIGLRFGVVLGSRLGLRPVTPLTKWNAVWEPTASRVNPMVAGLSTRQS
jgi:hypothetical protein